MTIPMLPGWGDDLKNNLPQLGAAIQDIINPHRKYEMALKNSIAADPSLLPKLATLAKDNPQALASIYGPNAAKYLQGLTESPDAILKRGVTGAATDILGSRGADVGSAALGIDNPTVMQGRQLQNAGQATKNAVDELTLDQKKTIHTALESLRTGNPEVYKQMSEIGALKEYFGTDPNTEAVKGNEAGKAKADAEARARVDVIANRASTPEGIKDLWSKFDKGEITPGDLGSAFDDPRTQGLKMYFDFQMKKQYEDFLLNKQAALLRSQEKRADEKSLKAKQDDEAKLRVQAEKQIAFNNVSIDKFIQRIKPSRSGEKALDESQITASLPQINELLQRNQVLKSLDPSTAPQFVMEKGGWFSGPKVHLMNADGTPNDNPDSVIKPENKVSVEGRPQGTPIDYSKSGSTKTVTDMKSFMNNPGQLSNTGTKPGRTSEVYYKMLSAGTRTLADGIATAKISKEDVISSKAYKALSQKEQLNLLSTFGWDK